MTSENVTLETPLPEVEGMQGERVGYLLTLMHDIGTEWGRSSNVQLRVWGAHLLNDWRTLELYAEKGR